MVEEIEKIRRAREARRRSAQFRKEEAPAGGSGGSGSGGGVKQDRDTLEFVRMIRAFREESGRQAQAYAPPGEHSIAVIVRKRPINAREVASGDYDAVTCLNPRAIVHAPKKKVDAITRYLENTAFQFDYAFDELCDTPAVYRSTVRPLVDFAFARGRGTCFAYGQTGSGKTHTMSGIQELVAGDLFERLGEAAHRGRLELHASFFEIYGGRAFDVLHSRNPVIIREDERHRVVASGLQEVVCHTCAQLQAVIAQGNASRTTHSTEVNAQSSRSHAICELTLRYTAAGAAAALAAGEGAGAPALRGASRPAPGGVHGSITLIDLAGSERAADSRNHAQARRIESAEINKSLLALKECIRALAVRAGSSEDVHVHVPFRASKLTLALRDSFEAANSRVVMIATVSPCASSWDHTGNTLRYADRVKEQPGSMEFDSEGRVVEGGAGGGGGGSGSAGGSARGTNSCAVAKSYSFSSADAIGSGVEVEGLRVSPVTVEGGEEGGAGSSSSSSSSGRGSGAASIITGAKAPPIAAFNRERIANARAAAKEREGGDSLPPTHSSSSSSSSGSASEAAVQHQQVVMSQPTAIPRSTSAAAPSSASASSSSSSSSSSSRGSLLSPPLRVPVQQQSRPASQQSSLRPPTSKPPLAFDEPADSELLPAGGAAGSSAAPAAAAAAAPSSVGIARLMQRGAIGKVGSEQPAPAAAAVVAVAAAGDSAAAAAAAPAASSIAKDVKAKFSSKGRAAVPATAAALPVSSSSSSSSSASAAAPASRANISSSSGSGSGGARADENLEPGAEPRQASSKAPPQASQLPSSPQQKDIRALHESMRRGGELAQGGEELLALHEAVGMIVDLEQELMDAHLKAIQVRGGEAEGEQRSCPAS